MEVHHHPHVDPDNHRHKNFKEYFLEFVMIFLAVTLGFFAESYREHLSDNSREKEYMKEIVANLKYDTERCNRNYKLNVFGASGIDTLRNEIKKAINGKADVNKMYYFTFLYARESNQAAFNTTAISELKSSGSLRLISNEKLIEQLADYYERKIFAAKSYLPDDKEIRNKEDEVFSMLNMDNYIFSFNNMDTTTYNNNYNFKNILTLTPALKLITNNPKEMEKLYNDVTSFELSIKRYNLWLSICKKAATELIAEIQKEYNLEND
ncbi:MAG: hypothetical protein M3Z92_13980 [Bacteroidota bacterium]|nr:hypothetical protein [Bacteroidota bacterium]